MMSSANNLSVLTSVPYTDKNLYKIQKNWRIFLYFLIVNELTTS